VVAVDDVGVAAMGGAKLITSETIYIDRRLRVGAFDCALWRSSPKAVIPVRTAPGGNFCICRESGRQGAKICSHGWVGRKTGKVFMLGD
jgi:hypothetical protein